MPETEPKYFTEFKNIVIKKFDNIDKRFDEIDARLDGHAEQIAEVTTNTIIIKQLLNNKADKEDVDKLTKRVNHLEKIHGI